MNEHTPTPWEVGESSLGLWITGPDKSANVICDFVGRGSEKFPVMLTNEDFENARFIVRAANAHESLVEALKGVAIMLNTEFEKYDAEPWAQRVRSALALANKEE